MSHKFAKSHQDIRELESKVLPMLGRSAVPNRPTRHPTQLSDTFPTLLTSLSRFSLSKSPLRMKRCT